VSLVPWRALDRVEPYERLLPAVALSTTGGKRVPPLTLLLRTPRAESLKSMPNAVRRPPRQGREPRAALRAPSIVECIVLGLRRIRPRGRSRGFAASILPPTLFRRRPPKRQVARRPLPWAHHPRALGATRRSSTSAIETIRKHDPSDLRIPWPPPPDRPLSRVERVAAAGPRFVSPSTPA
jgi:hypothetical protein